MTSFTRPYSGSSVSWGGGSGLAHWGRAPTEQPAREAMKGPHPTSTDPRPPRRPSKPPTFAVVIPTYQREKTLARALESALRQTFSASEIIVVDDGSTDGTHGVLDCVSLGSRGPPSESR